MCRFGRARVKQNTGTLYKAAFGFGSKSKIELLFNAHNICMSAYWREHKFKRETAAWNFKTGITKAFLLEHGERSRTVMFCLLSDVKNREDVFWVLCELQTTILLPLSPYWGLCKHDQTHKHQRAAASASHWWGATRRKHLSARELNRAIGVEARDRKWSITGGIRMETGLKMTRTFHNPTQRRRPWRHRGGRPCRLEFKLFGV